MVVGPLARRWKMLRGRLGFESRVVWILGSPRSGSTWLYRLLREHPAMVVINEPLIGYHLGPFLSDQPGWDAAALDEGNFTMRRVQDRNPAQFFADEFAHIWRPDLARMMRRRFLAHAIRYPSEAPVTETLVVVKEPNGSQSADVIMGALPKSRFLFLLRDGRDVVDSELAANLEGAWVTKDFPGGHGVSEDERLAFVEQSAMKWLWRTEVTQRAFALHPGPKLLLRYEDLLSDTERHLRELLGWLGAPLEEPRLRQLVADHAFERMPAEQRGPKGFYRAGRPGLWRESLRDAEQEVVTRAIGAKLSELGYPD